MKFSAPKSFTAALLMAGTFSGLSALPVAAEEDVDQSLAALQRLMALGGYELGFKDIEADRDRVTINNVRVRLPSLETLPESEIPFDASQPFSLPVPLILEDGSKDGEGNYIVTKMFLPEIPFEIEKAIGLIGEIAYHNVRLPKSETPDFLDMMIMSSGQTIGETKISIDGIEAIEIAPIVADIVFDPAQTRDVEVITSTVSVPSMKFFAENAPEGELDEEFVELVGGILDVSANAEFVWSVDDGRIQYKNWEMTANNVGKISFSFDMSGFTPEVVGQLMDLSRDLDPEDPTDQQAMMEWGMALLARSQFYSMTLKYEDMGVADRFFANVRAEEEMDAQDMARELLSEAEDMFEMVDSAEFEDMIRTAVTDFIANPQSFEIRVEPETPLPAMSFIGLAAAPKVLIETLGLEVIANGG